MQVIFWFTLSCIESQSNPWRLRLSRRRNLAATTSTPPFPWLCPQIVSIFYSSHLFVTVSLLFVLYTLSPDSVLLAHLLKRRFFRAIFLSSLSSLPLAFLIKLLAESMGSGFDELASRLSRVEQSVIVLEGYGGVLWDNFRTSLLNSLANLPQNKKYNWINIQSALKSERFVFFPISINHFYFSFNDLACSQIQVDLISNILQPHRWNDLRISWRRWSHLWYSI